jgi:hypothetical protein
MLSGCNHRQNLNAYTQTLLIASEPGYTCNAYVESFNTKDPLLLLKLVSEDIHCKWKHISDKQGKDKPVYAEKQFLSRQYSGDCEDKAVLLMSIARSLNLHARFCLARSRQSPTGHVWLEIKIGDEDKLDNDLIERIKGEFNDQTVLLFKDQYWLAFITEEDLTIYTPEYYMDNNACFHTIENLRYNE